MKIQQLKNVAAKLGRPLLTRALPLGLVAIGVAGIARSQVQQVASPPASGSLGRGAQKLRIATAEELEILSLLSVETLTDGSGASYPVLRITGADVQLVNGLGATNGNPSDFLDTDNTVENGLGNLIVGYASAHRGMSHSVLLGADNEIHGVGAIASGIDNEVSGAYAVAVGGRHHVVSERLAVAAGGSAADVAVERGVALGGDRVGVGGTDAVAFGGRLNSSDGYATVTTGGVNNRAFLGACAVVSGGQECTADGYNAVVAGGFRAQASGTESYAGGGNTNRAFPQSTRGAVLGGLGNGTTGNEAVVVGGHNNRAEERRSTVIGGFDNTAIGTGCVVGGGIYNIAGSCETDPFTGTFSCEEYMTINGGRDNRASTSFSNSQTEGLTLSGGLERQVSGFCIAPLEAWWRAGGTYDCESVFY